MSNIIPGQISDPPSGSVIVDFEGALNSTNIACDIVNRSRHQINTEWSISNFKGVSSFQMLSDPEIFLFSGDPIPGNVPTQTYQNRLTILILSNDLDRVTIFCGSSTFPTLAHFFFRIYRKHYNYLSLSLLTVTVNIKILCRPTQIAKKS